MSLPFTQKPYSPERLVAIFRRDAEMAGRRGVIRRADADRRDHQRAIALHHIDHFAPAKREPGHLRTKSAHRRRHDRFPADAGGCRRIRRENKWSKTRNEKGSPRLKGISASAPDGENSRIIRSPYQTRFTHAKNFGYRVSDYHVLRVRCGTWPAIFLRGSTWPAASGKC